MNDAVPKIEGHAAFYAHLKSGRVDKARIIGMENDRFVEKILFGRKYYEAPIITSRICGICPTIHNITSTKAIEVACGINPSHQTINLRKLMLCGQMIQSHALHLYLLVLPDFVGASSSFELQKSHPNLFQNAIDMKQYADKILDTIGGRAVHPISNVPGGFKSCPTASQITKLKKEGQKIKEVAEKTLRLFASFKYPKINQGVAYSALYSKSDYAYYDGDIKNTSGSTFMAENYTHYIFEELKPYTRAKFGTLKGEEFMVGAMARLNVNFKYLDDYTKNIIEELKLHTKYDNPFENVIAQAIENYFFVIESIRFIEHFSENGIAKEPVKLPKKFGKGTAACEAPRGTLFHHYEIDKNGYIVNCDIITPTVQNLPPLELAMKKLGPIIKDKKSDERTQIIEMLIRAYDPCITCATH